MNPHQARKVARRVKRIPGWLSVEASMLFAWVDEIQKSHSVTGNCFEIGCHHGKSALLLGSLSDPETEKLGVCDLFGMQEDNLSGSGYGDRDAFNTNLEDLKRAGLTIDVFQKNSAELSADEIGSDHRIFHIDGGHNPDEALTDLLLGAECTVDEGVLILDDPFRTEWPGVTEALIRFLDRRNEFEAIMVGFNKLLLARKRCREMYIQSFASMREREKYGFGYPWRVKQMPFHQTSLNVFYVPAYLVKKTPGNLARMVYHKSGLSDKRQQKVEVVQATRPIDQTTPSRKP